VVAAARGPFLPLVAGLAPRVLRRGSSVTIVEDLPCEDNPRNTCSHATNGLRFEFRYTQELRSQPAVDDG
jgi:hypothetical protein